MNRLRAWWYSQVMNRPRLWWYRLRERWERLRGLQPYAWRMNLSQLVKGVKRFVKELKAGKDVTLEIGLDGGAVYLGMKEGVVQVVVDQVSAGVFGERPVDGHVFSLTIHDRKGAVLVETILGGRSY
jgi:hypothetical protein